PIDPAVPQASGGPGEGGEDDRAATFALVAAELAWQDAGHVPERAPSRRRYALLGGALVGVTALALAAATLNRGPEVHARSGRVGQPPRVALAHTASALLPPIVTPSASAAESTADSVVKAAVDSVTHTDT